jgi:hypothetical protein
MQGHLATHKKAGQDAGFFMGGLAQHIQSNPSLLGACGFDGVQGATLAAVAVNRYVIASTLCLEGSGTGGMYIAAANLRRQVLCFAQHVCIVDRGRLRGSHHS